MGEQINRVLDERNRLCDLLAAEANVHVTDTGYSFVEDAGELAYEFGGHRFNIVLTEMPS